VTGSSSTISTVGLPFIATMVGPADYAG
jgi:hypothetical protein